MKGSALPAPALTSFLLQLTVELAWFGPEEMAACGLKFPRSQTRWVKISFPKKITVPRFQNTKRALIGYKYFPVEDSRSSEVL